ncbi:MAG TPA: plastocyanin/azurin family copper-binding protein [Gemmatimonadaceae bacterium]|jgi:plastocyanin
MRLQSWIPVVLAGVAAACGGGGKPTGSTTATTAAPPSGAAASSAAAATAQPVTGKIWDVKMLGDAQGYRFDPPTLTIKQGDGVRWTIVSGSPHNVTFWSDSIAAGAAPQLGANMSQTMAPLTGPLLMNSGQTYTVSFGGAPPGTYHYYCTPHLALGMKGSITVQ